LGITPEALVQPDQSLATPATPKATAEQVVDAAVEGIAVEQDTFTEKDVLRRALDSSIGTGLDVDDTIKATKQALGDPDKAIPLLDGPNTDRQEQRRMGEESERPSGSRHQDHQQSGERQHQTRAADEQDRESTGQDRQEEGRSNEGQREGRTAREHDRQRQRSQRQRRSTADQANGRRSRGGHKQEERRYQRERVYTSKQARKRQEEIRRRIAGMQAEGSVALPDRLIERTNDKFSYTANPVLEEIKHHAAQFWNAANAKKTKRINRPLIRQQAQQTLDANGKRLVRRLTQFPGRVTVISNSYVEQRNIALRAATKAWQKAGYEVIVTSPYRRTAKELEDATGARSMTFKKLELMSHPTFGYHVRHFVKQHVRAAFNKPTFSLNGYRIDETKVVIADRADKLTLDELSQLVRNVERHGGTLILLTPHLNDLPFGYRNLTAELLNDLSIPWPSQMGQQHQQQRPNQDQQPGMGMRL
jgi:hypothetical protein